jgi:hypothetical protein
MRYGYMERLPITVTFKGMLDEKDPGNRELQ